MRLSLYNTLTRRKEPFAPLDEKNVRMYVCGPTVYDRPHLGNARSVVVYDVLYRLLMHVYGSEHVTYVRNITDVDDKINVAAKANNEPISALTSRVEGWFHADMAALNVLPATRNINGNKDSKINGYMAEPHATHHIPEMVAMIQKLIENGHAYAADGHVLFSVTSYKEYGQLSGRKLDELMAGARVEVESYKKHPGDFVLWKPADAGDDPSSVFESPWGKGRPGWHIECSAMSTNYLGATFDLHGGGADLMFPHHENEIAQSRCALPGSQFARFWVHNGFLTVNGEKMSKSLGNFITVKDLLDKGVRGEVIRLALLMSKYNEPLDWRDNLIHSSKSTLDAAYRVLLRVNEIRIDDEIDEEKVKRFEPLQEIQTALYSDLNTPLAISVIPNYALMLNKWLDIGENKTAVSVIANRFKNSMKLLGLLQQDPDEWFKGPRIIEATGTAHGSSKAVGVAASIISNDGIQSLIDARIAAKKAKNFTEADRIRKELAGQGIILEDRPDGTTDWRRA
jgi:cysteinyl-tRNA synthetase